jgi:hypothetical protein
VVGLEFCLGMFSSAFLGIHGVVAEQGSCFVVEETRIWILPTSMMVELPCAAGAGIVSFRFLLAHSLPNLVQKCFLFFSFSFVSLFCRMKKRGFFCIHNTSLTGRYLHGGFVFKSEVLPQKVLYKRSLKGKQEV